MAFRKLNSTIVIILGLLATNFLRIGVAQAQPDAAISQAPGDCLPLVIMLDRSGSINETDPGNYSASAVKLLAQVWYPCPVALVTYPGKSTGFLDTTDPAQLQQLFSLADQRADGGTPMAQAAQQAFDLLNRQHAGPGAVVVNITDGMPDEAQPILNLLPSFTKAGYQINTVGLAQADGNFLGLLARQTGGNYYRANNAENFASIALDIYARYKKLTLLKLGSGANLTKTFQVDPYAGRVILVVGKEGSGQFNLTGPNGPIGGSQVRTGSDPHYELVDAARLPTGSYSLQASGQQAAAYVLIDSSLALSSKSGGRFARGQNLPVEAQFVRTDNQNGTVVPVTEPNPAEVNAQAEVILPDGNTFTTTLRAVAGGRIEGELPGDRLNTSGLLNVRLIGDWKGIIRTTTVNFELINLPHLLEDLNNPPLWTLGGGPAQPLELNFRAVVDEYNPQSFKLNTNPVELTNPQFGQSELVRESQTLPVQVVAQGNGHYQVQIPPGLLDGKAPNGTSDWEVRVKLKGQYQGMPVELPLTMKFKISLPGSRTNPMPTPEHSGGAVIFDPCKLPGDDCGEKHFPWWILAVIGLLLALWAYLRFTAWPQGRLAEVGALDQIAAGREPNLLVNLSKLSPDLLGRLLRPGRYERHVWNRYSRVRPLTGQVVMVARGKKVELYPDRATKNPQVRSGPTQSQPVSSLEVVRKNQPVRLPAILREGDLIRVANPGQPKTFEAVYLKPAKRRSKRRR